MIGYVFAFFVINALLVAVNLRGYRWLRRAFRLSRAARHLIVIVLAASLLVTATGRFIARHLPEVPIAWPLLVALTIQLTVLVVVLVLAPLDLWCAARRGLFRASALFPTSPSFLTKALPKLERWLPKRLPPVLGPAAANEIRDLEQPLPEEPIERRRFTTQALVGAAFLASGSSSIYGVLKGRHDYTVEEVPIRVANLSHKLDGFTIAQLSDLHIGLFVGEPELASAVDLVRRAKPDLIVVTGDLIDNDPRLTPLLGRFLRRLQGLAREGVTVISGNHDYYTGIKATLQAVRQGGATMLRNRGLVIGDAEAGFALLGVDDLRGRHFEPGGGPHLNRAIRSLPRLGGRLAPARDLPRVLLCHNPSYFAKASSQVALQLSGHTHGGQYNPGLRPAQWLFEHGWIAGRYEFHGAQLYVNRGFGTAGPPVRLGAPPEVTRLVLTSA